jgi:hypothetical protein
MGKIIKTGQPLMVNELVFYNLLIGSFRNAESLGDFRYGPFLLLDCLDESSSTTSSFGVTSAVEAGFFDSVGAVYEAVFLAWRWSALVTSRCANARLTASRRRGSAHQKR